MVLGVRARLGCITGLGLQLENASATLRRSGIGYFVLWDGIDTRIFFSFATSSYAIV